MKILKSFRKIVISFAVLTILFGIVAVPIAHAWSNWQNVSRLVHMPGGTSVTANGSWRHRLVWISADHGENQAETHSTGFRGVAISNGHRETASRAGQTIRSTTARRMSGNTSGWDIVR